MRTMDFLQSVARRLDQEIGGDLFSTLIRLNVERMPETVEPEIICLAFEESIGMYVRGRKEWTPIQLHEAHSVAAFTSRFIAAVRLVGPLGRINAAFAPGAILSFLMRVIERSDERNFRRQMIELRVREEACQAELRQARARIADLEREKELLAIEFKSFREASAQIAQIRMDLPEPGGDKKKPGKPN